MRKLLTCGVMLSCSIWTFGQRTFDENAKTPFMDRVYFAGGLGFSSGTNTQGYRYTFIGLYPVIGYMVTNQFSTGASITYQHSSYPDVPLTINQYGISPFVRYNFNQLFLYSEYMILNSPVFNDPNQPRQIYNRLLMGVGYHQPMGKRGRGGINAMVLYDVLYNPTEVIFNSPWVVRVFFSF